MENSAIEVIERHGDEVEIISCEDKSDRLTLLHTGELSRLIVSGQEPCQHL